MAHPRRCRFLKDVAECTGKGTLLNPRELVALTWMSENLSTVQIKDLVLGQVAIAKKNNNTAWLKSMAKEATSAFDDTWVSQHIYSNRAVLEKRDRDRIRQERHSEAVFMPVRDIRLDYDPSLPHRREEIINRPLTPHSPLLDLTESRVDELVGDISEPPMEEVHIETQSSECMPPMVEASCRRQSSKTKVKTGVIKSPVRFPRPSGVSPIAVPSRRQSPRRREISATITRPDASPVNLPQSPMEVTVKCTSGRGSGHRVVTCELSPEHSPKRSWKKGED